MGKCWTVDWKSEGVMNNVQVIAMSAWRPPSEPPTKVEGKLYSAYIWVRVAALYRDADEWMDGKKSTKKVLVREAYTTIGRCYFPKVYSHSEPYNHALADSAGKTVWIKGDPVYQEGHQAVIATHWMPISEPLPPELEQHFFVSSGTQLIPFTSDVTSI